MASLVVDPEDVDRPPRDADDGAEVALRRTAVRAALAQLPGREREIIALKFHAGLRNGELARVLGVCGDRRRHPPVPRDGEAEEGLRCDGLTTSR